MTRFLILALLTFVLCLGPSAPADAPPHPLVVFLLPGTSLSDWRSADAPALHRIMATGSLAVMNTRSARLPNDHRRETPESAALTLGAGSRSVGGSEVTDFHPASEIVPGLSTTYGSLYARRNGTLAPSDAEVNVEWPKVQRENSGQGYDLRPGNLGDGLGLHNTTVLVGGGRFARPLACDSAGVARPTARGGRFPRQLPPVMVWDAGPDIPAADAVIRKAASAVSAQGGRLMIVSPFVSDLRYSRGERLAPIVVWGAGVPPGLLFSPSTHRPGLVTNTDFAPSVTAYFGAAARTPWLPTAPFGHPWMFRDRGDAVATVALLEAASYQQAHAMRILPFVAVCLGLVAFGQCLCFWRGISCRPLLWMPGVIVFALLVSGSIAAMGAWVAALSLVFRWLQGRVGVPRLLAVSAALTVLVLIGDTLSGSRLMRTDLLGYSAVEGARYYGSGNEAMGALIGSALVAASAVWSPQWRRRIAVALALFGLTLLLGLPSAGAKAGGLLVAGAAFGTFLWTAWGKRWNGRVIVGVLAGMALALTLVSLSDWHHPTGEQSHLGGAIQRIASGGFGEAVDIIRRKLAVESHLLYHSAWAIPLWSCLFGLGRYVQRFQSSRRGEDKALVYGSVAALMVCLAANDAGVVAAALCGAIALSGLYASQTEKRPPSDSSAV